ncbi:TPA: hypothetical protein EYG96_02415 [Candidatus Gracilibacteria bacterium]|nr:hypothetical protein [Candidatus Gracilibacteria bacterium]
MSENNETSREEIGNQSVARSIAKKKEEIGTLEKLAKAREDLAKLQQKSPSANVQKKVEVEDGVENPILATILGKIGLSSENAKAVADIGSAVTSEKELGFFDKIGVMKKSFLVLASSQAAKIVDFIPGLRFVIDSVKRWFGGKEELGDEGFDKAYSSAKKDIGRNTEALPYNLRGDVYDQGLQIIADKESANGKFVWNAQDHKNSSWGVFQFQGAVFDGFIKFLKKNKKSELASELSSFYSKNNYKKGKSIAKKAKELSDLCRVEQVNFVKQTQLMQRVGEMKKYLPISLKESRNPITTLLIYNITHQCGWDLRISILKEAKKNYSNEKSYQSALIKVSDKKANSKSDIKDRMQRISQIKAVSNPHPNLNESVEASPAKPFTTPYIHFIYPKNFTEDQIEEYLEQQLDSLGYPDTLFVDNSKNQNPHTVKKSINILKSLYVKMDKFPKIFPKIFMDNENGTVQRVTGYLGSMSSKEKELQDLLDRYVPQAGSLHKGRPSMRSMEELFEKYPNKKKELMENYAEIRIKKEMSLGLNSVSLVLDEGADIPKFDTEKERQAYKKTGDVINLRGFKSSEMRIMYAQVLIEKASENGMKVLLKHFPGHKGIPNPHSSSLSIKKELNAEMKTFLEILDWTKEKGKKNVVVMLGHIKLGIPNTGWDSEGKPIFASSKVMTKLHKDYPDITFMTDDIGGMDAIGDKEKARNDARKNEVFALN